MAMPVVQTGFDAVMAALLAAALEAMADIESGYERVIGPARMRSLKKALADIAAAADPAGVLARR